MSDDPSVTIRALSERVRELKAAAEREQEPFERRLAQAQMGRTALSLARATLAAADLDDDRPAGPFAVELVRRLCEEVHDADPTNADDREALALLFDVAEEAAVVADVPARAAEVRGGAALVRYAARTLREVLYEAGHSLFGRSGAFRDDPRDAEVPDDSDQLVLLTCHLGYAAELVRWLGDEVQTVDLSDPGQRRRPAHGGLGRVHGGSQPWAVAGGPGASWPAAQGGPGGGRRGQGVRPQEAAGQCHRPQAPGWP
jgi:hypothetical protein